MISTYDKIYHLFIGFLIHKGLLRDFEKHLTIAGGIKALIDSEHLHASDRDGEPAQDWEWAENLIHTGFYFDTQSNWKNVSNDWIEYLSSSRYGDIEII